MSFDVTTLALAKSYADQHGGGGASTAGDFIIKMTVEGNIDDGYTVTSCDATVEQIDAAVAAEKRVVVISTDTANGAVFELPMLQGMEDNSYYFGMFLMGRQVIASFVQKIGENKARWQFLMTEIEADAISYSNDMMPDVFSVGDALNKLVPKSHTHANKGILDKLSDSNGKLQYNGSDVGLKGEKGDTGAAGADGYTPVKGTDYWTAADKAEIVADTLAALPTWTGGSY